MSETLGYYTLDELNALSLPELAALWELVPTDRQRRYKTVYDREVKQAGAVGSDALEKHVTEELLNRYLTTALVPIGARWARTPTRIQEAVRTDADLVAPEAVEEQNRVSGGFGGKRQIEEGSNSRRMRGEQRTQRWPRRYRSAFRWTSRMWRC